MRYEEITRSEELQKAFHYFFEKELGFFKNLVRKLDADPVIVNIGAGAGTSGLAALEAREDSFVYTIDIQDENSPTGCLFAEREVVKRAGKLHRLRQIHGDSKDVGKRWTRGQVDMVYVDGDHSYEGCKQDILIWLNNIKDNGIMVIHDYQKYMVPPYGDVPGASGWPDVCRAVDEILLPNFEKIKLVDSLISFRIK